MNTKNTKNGIIQILAIVLIFAVFFQVLRSNYVMSFFKNDKTVASANSYSSSNIPSGLNKEKFLVLFDSEEDSSEELKNNIVQTLKYMKKDAVVENYKDVQTLDNSNKAVIFTFEALDKFKNLPLLINYVNNGGNVLFAERPLDGDSLSSISNMLGISKVNSLTTSNGLKLLSNILIKGNGLSVSGDIISSSSLNVTLNNNCKVLATSKENIPMIWQTTFGNGNVMIFNGSNLGKKVNRGLITGLISTLLPNYIYPVMGAKLAYIDDFPSPVPSGYDEGIKKEYGLTVAQFYKEVWWPSILKGAKIYNLKYTGTIIENYDANTTPPFKSETASNNDFILEASELLKNGGEMGIHGYNHQSLAPENYIKEPLGYKPWKSISDMEKSISEVVNYSNTAFSNYSLRVYVPPSNILSPEGKKAIINAMPNLETISSLYTADAYGDSYVQEFEVKNGISELPRISSGYNDSEETLWDEYNSITSLGVFSHFIHPDDVLDSRRNEGKDWAELLKDYNSLLLNVSSNFKWLKPVTASEGSNLLKNYSEVEPFIEYKGDLINVYCKNFKDTCEFILRSNNEIYPNSGCSVNKIDTGVYLVTAKKSSFSLKHN